ncbi:SDR family NAD(P)-dependent oxidoreductase [Micromonospora sp. 067-2]|uniref:SDR family NAD(P)-dependent oxidoreductase n=1 Tax=Micromonospora sp. 067-2 TaxID=2789270 RepID=UPI003979E86D
MIGLSGRVAVVTGGASGIGAATVRRLTSEGAAVVVVDVASADEVIEGVRSAGGRAVAVRADVAHPDGWAEVADTARREYGSVHILHSNAAFQVDAEVTDLTVEQWQRTLDVNVGALFHAVRALGKDLRANRGAIVVTSSVHAVCGMPRNAAYAASKGGLDGLVRQLAAELAPEVRVNAVLPGPVRTPAWDPSDEDAFVRAGALTALRRMAHAEEIASVVAFLASDDASYITGVSLPVDGGWLATR